jgi:hypothetical protein
MNALDILKDSQIFAGMDLNKINVIANICEPITFQKDEIIFNEGDPGDSLLFIKSGEVKIFKSITSYYEETLARLGKGTVFGEMSFIDRVSRSTSAVATERTELLSLSRSKFDSIIASDQVLGTEVMKRLSQIISERIRKTNEMYKDTIIWYLEIMGVTSLSFYYIIQNRIEIEIGFNHGGVIKGRIINVGKGEAGYEVTLRDNMDRLYIIPYSAINYLSIDYALIQPPVSSIDPGRGGIL